MTSLNEDLEDLAIRHAIQLSRLRTGEARKVGRSLRAAMRGVIAETLSERYGPRFRQSKRYENLVKRVDKIINKAVRDAHEAARRGLLDLGKSEADIAVGSISNFSPINLGLNAPATEVLKALVDDNPFQGRTLTEWFSTLSQGSARKYRDALNVGLALGEGAKDLAARASKSLGVTQREAEVIMRTAYTHVATSAREAAYKANKDVVKGVRYLATLDARTTDICASLDGRVFKVNEGPRPPMHHQCRSTTTPILKSWKELGINLKEPVPASRAARRYNNDMTRAFRATVPAKQTYQQWLKRQPKHVQDEALGVRKAQLFRQGTPITKFVDSKYRSLTLDQIEAQLSDVVAIGPKNTEARKRKLRQLREGGKAPVKGNLLTPKSKPGAFRGRAGDNKPWARNLTSKEENAIIRWSEDFGNKEYRGFQLGTRKKSLGWFKDFNSAMVRAPRHKGTAYRGLAFYSDKKYADFKKAWATGRTTELKAHASFTKKERIAEQFALGDNLKAGSPKAQVVFKVKNGKNGVDIENLSVYKREKELVYLRGQKFRIVSAVEKTGRSGGAVIPRLEVTLEEIFDKRARGNVKAAASPVSAVDARLNIELQRYYDWDTVLKDLSKEGSAARQKLLEKIQKARKLGDESLLIDATGKAQGVMRIHVDSGRWIVSDLAHTGTGKIGVIMDKQAGVLALEKTGSVTVAFKKSQRTTKMFSGIRDDLYELHAGHYIVHKHQRERFAKALQGQIDDLVQGGAVTPRKKTPSPHKLPRGNYIDVEKVKKAKTAKEATEAFFNEQRRVRGRDMWFPDNLHMHKDVAVAMAEEYNRFISMFPNMKNQYWTISKPSAYMQDAYAWVQTNNTSLHMSTRWWGPRNKKKGELGVRQNFREGWLSGNPNRVTGLAHTIRHETGHVFDYYETIRRTSQPKRGRPNNFSARSASQVDRGGRFVLKSWHKLYWKDSNISNISRYGSTSETEAFAEVFAYITSTPTSELQGGLRTLANELRDYITTNGGRIPDEMLP